MPRFDAQYFDEIIPRAHMPSSKWHKGYLKDLFLSEDVLPFWIADMDFRSPPSMLNAIKERADYGILAYEYTSDSYYEALISWIGRRQGYQLSRAEIMNAPSIATSTGLVIEAFTEKGDGIIIQPPVFMEYRNWITSSGRRPVKNTLKEHDGEYSLDLEDLESKAADPANKILLICNPQNPLGRTWSEEELKAILEICIKHDVLCVSDEVHADIIYSGHRFTSILCIEGYEDLSVVLYSGVKTFNLGGFGDSHIFCRDEVLRSKIAMRAKSLSLGKTNGIVRAALEAAFNGADDWLDGLLLYFENNWKSIDQGLEGSKIRFRKPDASYQLWLDFRDFELDAKELHRSLCLDAGIGLNAGYWFGREGAGFARMNIASPLSVIDEGVSKLKDWAQKKG